MKINTPVKIFAIFCAILYCFWVVSYIKNDVEINFNKSKKYTKTKCIYNQDIFSLKYIIINLHQNIKLKSSYFSCKNKRQLSNRIISNYYKTNLKTKFIFYKDIDEILDIINYISDADSVSVISQKTSALPDYITQNQEILFSAKYNSITNYYSKNGNLVYREYKIDNKPYRYQNYDKDGNFYTYDKNFKLLEYSRNLTVYNSADEILFTSNSTSKKHGGNHKYDYTSSVKTKFIEALNNKDSDLYKSITPIIDKHYSNGSYKEIITDLNKYFSDTKNSNPGLYKKYINAIGDTGITINFAKTNDDYIFSANQTYYTGLQQLIHSMANGLNTYRGRCAETVLKTLSKDKIAGRYFYDLKLYIDSDCIKIKEHAPCDTCARNISLWGWKYPKTSIKSEVNKQKSTF